LIGAVEFAANGGGRLQQPVADPVMIAFAMIVGHILRNRVPERCLPKEDHPSQTFFLGGTDKSPRPLIVQTSTLIKSVAVRHSH